MKSIQIKTLVALLVISMSLCSSLNRVTKSTSKTATKTAAKSDVNVKSDGSGSWDGGYECPFVELETNGKIIATTGRYTFNASKQTGKYGFVFQMKSIPDSLKAYTYTTTNGETYIPWRYWDTVGYFKKDSSYKMITGWLRNDAGQTVRVRFNLPWALWSSYISVDECNKIVDNIQKWGTEQKTSITSRKRNATTFYSKMVNYKKALDTSKDDAAALKQKLQTNIQKNQGILQTKKAQLAQITTQIGAITSAVQVLNAQTEALSVQINENNNKQFNNLKLMDDQQRQKMFAGIDAQIKTEVDQVAGDITTLQQVVTNVSLDFIAAAASKGDADKVTNLLLNIQPATTSSG